ncbi:DsrH/TusB family sulfur relay protein [Marinomonas atlantica]|uniref:DsrH/TusB family sulfur relay protein n=1 Tax=Marinomonas atlantica TaxID=1806668 RepID=UPI00083615A4|nr:DsrH/TusB family sulfur metabolism protein [Marinomonas atlantica]MCO4786266.1 hypothetical protein [Marinomonas atlantica]
MKLYQINKSMYPQSVEQDWQLSLVSGDAVLLMEVGVLRALTQQSMLTQLIEKGVNLYFREHDLTANGLSVSFGEAISDPHWVDLTTQYDKIVSW